LWIEWVEMVAVGVGVFFMFVSAMGVLRLRDFYQRVHAPTKAATLGLTFLLIAVAMNVRETTVVTKAVLALLFIGATAPVGAHLLSRAAYRNGIKPVQEPVVDEYAAVVSRRKASPAEPSHAEDIDEEEARARAGG
jgi:multicomponent Na+:H+ antiporter subunit G